MNDTDYTLFQFSHDLSFYIRHSKREGCSSYPRPSCLYFTASWRDSLIHPDLSKLTSYLLDMGVDVIACDIPFHPEGITSYDTALEKLREAARSGQKVITPFAQKVAQALVEMEKKGLISLSQLALAGLSRGAFCAAHTLSALSKKHQGISLPVALLAPLMSLLPQKESLEEPDSIERELFPLQPPIPSLFLSIGNDDKRVGTDLSFSFFQRFMTEAKNDLMRGESAKLRSASVDATLHVHPSIGFQGHGTPDAVFELAAHWIQSKLQPRINNAYS